MMLMVVTFSAQIQQFTDPDSGEEGDEGDTSTGWVVGYVGGGVGERGSE